MSVCLHAHTHASFVLLWSNLLLIPPSARSFKLFSQKLQRNGFGSLTVTLTCPEMGRLKVASEEDCDWRSHRPIIIMIMTISKLPSG